MKQPLRSIIIANYNGEIYLTTCVESVLKSNYKNFELLIVDDGSTDRSVEIIKDLQRRDNRIKLLRNRENLGAAASRNKAIKKTKGEVVVFLDNDTEVNRDWLDELIKPLLREKDIGGTQALLLDFEKRELIQMAGGLLIPHVGWLAPLHVNKEYKSFKRNLKERDIIAISAALAVKKEVLDKVGGFDEKEAVYTEDIDLSWRIWIAGYRIVLAPKSVVYHWTKSVERRADMKADYRQIYFHLAKNSFRSIIKNYKTLNILRFFLYSFFINITRAVLVLMRRKSPSAILGTAIAIIWSAANLGDTLRQRSFVQSTRVYSDSELLRRVFTRESLLETYKKHFKQN